jgi:hypothetical protein
MTGYILEEEKLESIQKEVTGDPKIHCLIGHGTGNQYYAKADLRYMGIWCQDIYEVKNGFKDVNGILKPYTDAKYAQRQMDYIWSATYYQDVDHKLLLRAGDFVTLQPLHENAEYLSCQSVESTADGKIKLELGAKRPTFLDSKEVLQNSPHGFVDRYMRENHEAITITTDFYPSDPTHEAVPGSANFTVPDNVKNVGDRPIITISLSLRPKTNAAPDYGRVAIKFWAGSGWCDFSYLTATTIGEAASDSLPEIEVTDLITAGASNVISIYVIMAKDYTTAHTVYTEHPAISMSATMNFYKRGELSI